ncbi:hypothetical protein AMTRI_Chr03g54630 [Amborella trichopoda]
MGLILPSSIMIVTPVPGQQTLNYKSELAELNGSALTYQNMLISFLPFLLIHLPTEILYFFDDIVACGDQVQRVRGSLVAHLLVHVFE